MLSAMKEAASDAAAGVSNATTSALEFGRDAAVQSSLKVAEEEIRKQTGKEIEVVVKDIPKNWKEWVMKTGVNSLCNDSTWDFLERSESNKRKLDLWEKRGIRKIVMTVNENPDPDMSSWAVCEVQWTEGSDEVTIEWLPRALQWNSTNAWIESGPKCWWIIRDELVFGLQLYQLDGKCFYKSDWLDGVSDPDETATLPGQTKKFKRWFQFRHWIIYWYPKARWGWNYQWTVKPPPNPDGSLFNLDSVLTLPGMPDFDMPKPRLPTLPDVEMPSLPNAPSLPKAPSFTAPNISAPSLSAPDLSAPNLSMPKQPKRPDGRWACHGYIEMTGLKCIAKGNKLILTDAKVTNFWRAENGHGIDHKTEEHQRLELVCTDEVQATSWVKSLVAGGAEEGEVGSCCSVV